MSDIRALHRRGHPGGGANVPEGIPRPRQAVTASLESYLRELFSSIPGGIPKRLRACSSAPTAGWRGFIGVLPMRMSFDGQPVRPRVAKLADGDNPGNNPLAGARLLRSYLTGPQELSSARPSNPVAQGMWERIGGEAMPSTAWNGCACCGRPGRRGAGCGAVRAASMLRPLARLADRASAPASTPSISASARRCRLIHRRGRRRRGAARADPALSANYALQPDWDRAIARACSCSTPPPRAGTAAFSPYGLRPRQRADRLLSLLRPAGRRSPGCCRSWRCRMRPTPSSTICSRTPMRQGCVAVRGRTQPELLDTLLRTAACSSSAPRPRSIPATPSCSPRSAPATP